MEESNFTRIYDKFKLQFYRKVFELVRERDGSLSAMEAFSLEVIHMLDHPTISQFADFLNISQSNATYKVNSLIRKGYIERENSTTDRREYHLNPTEKFYNYIGLYSDYQKVVLERVSKRFTAEDTAKFEEMLGIIVDELMPECEK
ncbi:MAG: MarR family transcriptional regulator [Oscillospiraceae bacterium]|nr:MarR family transcriptional regulator [Oscillospiraceae bacterium]